MSHYPDRPLCWFGLINSLDDDKRKQLTEWAIRQDTTIDKLRSQQAMSNNKEGK